MTTLRQWFSDHLSLSRWCPSDCLTSGLLPSPHLNPRHHVTEGGNLPAPRLPLPLFSSSCVCLLSWTISPSNAPYVGLTQTLETKNMAFFSCLIFKSGSDMFVTILFVNLCPIFFVLLCSKQYLACIWMDFNIVFFNYKSINWGSVLF